MKRAEIKALKKCKSLETQRTAALILLFRSLQFGHKRLFKKRLASAIALQAMEVFPPDGGMDGARDAVLAQILRQRSALALRRDGDGGDADGDGGTLEMFDRLCSELQRHGGLRH